MIQSVLRTRRAARLVPVLIAALAMLALAACGGDDDAPTSTAAASSPSAAAAAAFPVTFTDSSNTPVTLSAAPKRIVSYSPAVTETLFAIGAAGQVVAVDKFSNYPAGTAPLPKVEYSKPAPEPAVALNPDLILMSGQQEGQVPQFRALGLKVVFLKEPPTVAGVLDQITNIGKLTGHASEAATLTASMQKRIDAVAQKLATAANAPAPKVFYELSPDGFTVGPNSFIGSLLKLVKAGNVAEKATGDFPQINAEVVIATNPDVILLTDSGYPGGETADSVKARPGWGNLNAVKNGRVFPINADIFNRPGPRVVDALEQLLKLCYPGLQ